MPATMKELTQLTGYSRDKINKLIARGIITSKLPKTVGNQPREFSRKNVMEICFTAALEPFFKEIEDASRMARSWINDEANGKWSKFYAWRPSRDFFFPDGRTAGFAFDNHKYSIDDIAVELADVPVGYADREGEEGEEMASDMAIIPRGAILKRIDKLLAVELVAA